MKKVLLTVNNNKLSGIERFTLLLSKYLDKNKYQVEVAIPIYGQFCELLQENNISYFIFNNDVTERYTVKGILWLFRKIHKEKYDIIHSQAGILPCIIGTLLGTKLVIEHRHGLDFTCEQIEKMKQQRTIYEKMKKYFVDYTITVCQSDKNILIQKFSYNDAKTVVVYNGIENVTVNGNANAESKFIVGTIGRLTFQKGQEYFIEMASKLIKEGYNFEYHIYGDGEKLDEYQDLIFKNNLEDKVFLKGYTECPLAKMKTFSILVVPSRYEGIPYVILEAMRESIPILATNVGGINEVIRNMENGILVEKENVNELVDNVKLLANNKDLRKQLSTNAKRDFNEKYNIKKTVKCVESIYEIL